MKCGSAYSALTGSNLEHFRIYRRLPCPHPFRAFLRNGGDTCKTPVYTIPENALESHDACRRAQNSTSLSALHLALRGDVIRLSGLLPCSQSSAALPHSEKIISLNGFRVRGAVSCCSIFSSPNASGGP
jgi:hypothetical protein